MRPSRPSAGLMTKRSWWYQIAMSGRSCAMKLTIAWVSGSLAGPVPAYWRDVERDGAAAGVGTAADGASQLASGSGELVSGTTKLNAGAQQASEGSAALAKGAGSGENIGRDDLINETRELGVGEADAI